jgi:hypothetical protein
MSYLYAVNRDNPLGYFPIDSDYTYYNLKNAYTTYGGTLGNDHTAGNIYDQYAGFTYGYLNTLRVVDSTSYSNNPSILGIGYSSPIVMGNKTSAKITSSSSIEIKNIYDVFVPSSNPHTWSTEFWTSFDWMDGQSLDFTQYDNFSTNNYRTDIGFKNSIISYPKIYLLSIGYYTTVSGGNYFYNYASILYNQETNCIEFYVPQKSGGYAKSYCVITDLNTPLHIYATYSNKTINISVNGKTGISAYVGDGLFQDSNISNNYQNLIFRIAGSYNDFSTVPPTVTSLEPGQYFLVSNLAFYDYLLTSRQLNDHIKWGMYDNKPIKSSTQYGTHMFALEESPQNFQYGKIFNGKAFQDYSSLYNLNITSQGLESQKINRVIFNNIDKTSVLSVPTDFSGIQWLGGKAALDFFDFGKISSMPCTISLVVESSLTHDDEYIWSINNVNGSSTLFVERLNGIYNLKFYDTLNGVTTTLASVTPDNTLNYHKIAVSMANNSILLTVISSLDPKNLSVIDITTQSAIYAKTIIFSNNSILTIGQSYHNGNDLSLLKVNSSSFTDLGICDLYIDDFTNQYINGYYYPNGYPWSGIIKYAVPFQYYVDPYYPVSITQSFAVNQMCHWTTNIPLASMDSILGSKIGWSSTNNALVEYSFYDPSITNQETNWKTVTRKDGFISGYNFSNKLSNMLIRVTGIVKSDNSDLIQSFNNLEIAFYKNMNFYSEGEYFLLTPASKSINNSSFTVKSHGKPIQTRSPNLGLLFPYSVDDLSVPGYAKITNLYSKNVAGIDFWYRPDTNFINSNIIIGDTTSASGYPNLYIDSTGAAAYNSAISAIYINGLYVSNSATASSVTDQISRFTFSANTPVHICVVFDKPYITDIYVNGLVSSPTIAGIGDSTGSYNPNNTTLSYNSGTTTILTPNLASPTTIGQNQTAGRFAVTVGRTYTVTGAVKMASSYGTRTGKILINWVNSAGTFLSASAGTLTTLTTTNQTLSLAAVAPATAAYAYITFDFEGVFPTENYTISTMTATDSVSGSLTIAKIGDGTGSYNPTNAIITYTSGTNTTLIIMPNLANPTIIGQNQTTGRFKSLNPATHTLSANSRMLSSYGTRTASLSINWEDLTGTFISSTTGTPITLTTSDQAITVSATPPYNAVYGYATVNLNGVLNAETYYVDALSLNFSATGSESSYGYINLWENGVSQQDAVNRYNLFTQNSLAIATNDNSMTSLSNPLLFDLRKTMPIVHKIGS